MQLDLRRVDSWGLWVFSPWEAVSDMFYLSLPLLTALESNLDTASVGSVGSNATWQDDRSSLHALLLRCSPQPPSEQTFSKKKAATPLKWKFSAGWGTPCPMSCWYGVSTRNDVAMGIRERVTRLELVDNGLSGKRRVGFMRGAASGIPSHALAVAPFASLYFSPYSRNDININSKRFAERCYLVRFCFLRAFIALFVFFRRVTR